MCRNSTPEIVAFFVVLLRQATRKPGTRCLLHKNDFCSFPEPYISRGDKPL